MVAYVVTGSGTISLVVNGKSYLVATDHINYDKVKEELFLPADERNEELLVELIDIPKAIVQASAGKVQVRDGVVYYKDSPLHNSMTTRVLDLLNQGFNVEPMLKFLDNLMENPSFRAVNELYGFLEHRGLPITEEGTFLSYKGVRADGYDRHSGTVLNEIGETIEMPRQQVNDDCTQTCSYGYHVGTIEYVRGYCTEKVLIVEVNPADAVSVPIDHDAQKLRVCKYKVVGLYEGDLDQAPVYRSDAKPLYDPFEDCDEEDLKDDEYFDDEEDEEEEEDLEFEWETEDDETYEDDEADLITSY